MADGVRSRDGRYAGDRRLLDRPFPAPGELRISGQRGERAAYQDASGPPDRCIGMPMATKASHLRTVKQFISSARGNPSVANLSSTTGKPGDGREHMHPAHAENAHAD